MEILHEMKYKTELSVYKATRHVKTLGISYVIMGFAVLKGRLNHLLASLASIQSLPYEEYSFNSWICAT